MIVQTLLAFSLGGVTWTLLEYCIHRWLGHHPRLRPNPFGTEHTRHHAEGNYFAAFGRKMRLAGIVMGCLAPFAVWMAGPLIGGAWTVGVVTAYGLYERVHLSAHVSPPKSGYGVWLRRHHFWHHFGNPSRNHGVTSPVWDIIFGTLDQPSGKIAVPHRLAMPWLVDPATGTVRDEHTHHYILRGPSPAGHPPRSDAHSEDR